MRYDHRCRRRPRLFPTMQKCLCSGSESTESENKSRWKSIAFGNSPASHQGKTEPRGGTIKNGGTAKDQQTVKRKQHERPAILRHLHKPESASNSTCTSRKRLFQAYKIPSAWVPIPDEKKDGQWFQKRFFFARKQMISRFPYFPNRGNPQKLGWPRRGKSAVAVAE